MTSELLRTPIDGVFEIISMPFVDHRGSFLNAYRSQGMAWRRAWGDRSFFQVNISRTDIVGTVRGLHFQAQPFSEAKLVRCLHGKVWDLAVDLRKDSSTYGQWHAVELSSNQGNSLLIPEGCAHGFQVIEENSQLLYIHSEEWIQKQETGIRWDDPLLDIKWPLNPSFISEKDLLLPFLREF